MQHEGSCHCGKVRYTIEADITEAISCNCSMCRRKGSLLTFVPMDKFVLQTPEADMGTYVFNTQMIRHHFCRTCGVSPLAIGKNPKTGDDMAAINVRCLPDVDLDALTIKAVNGAAF